MLQLVLIPAVLFALGVPAQAVDRNQNGMSDVWESLYPVDAAQPQSDPDGDGSVNLREAQAWTDPGSAASVHRIQLLGHSVDEFEVVWRGQPWERYQLRRSAEVQAGWRTAGSQRTGQGTNLAAQVSSSADRQYFLVESLPALNSDTDALTNHEEAELGTNPQAWDSDGDQVADDVEFHLGTDPLVTVDTDADLLPDDWERWIIGADTNDAVAGLADVVPGDDFDADGVNNSNEFALGTSPVDPKRHIVFFLAEDQGYHGAILGTAGIDTPGMDTLGGGGVIFDRAFALSPVCSPSKMAFYTGTYPHMNAGYRNVVNYGTNFPLTGDPSVLNLSGVHEDLPTLIEILRDRGWFTAVTHKTHVQPIRKFPYHKGYPNGAIDTPADGLSTVTDAVAAAGDRPLFLLFGVPSPHLPFKNLPNINGQWSGSGGLVGDGHVLNVDPSQIEVPNCYPDLPAVRQDIADYYGAIEVVDSIFAAVTNGLQTSGVLTNTLVVYTGDHGIGLHRAKQSVYGAGLHVPLLIDGPGVVGARRITEPVTHLDLAMTMIDFAGLSPMPAMHGKSLWPILRGAQADFPDRETVLTACHDKYDARAACDGRYYYITNLRQVAGATLRMPQLNAQGIDPLLDRALNTDQYKGGSPWFNRTFAATVGATGSPQRELLRQLVEGDLPDEELYDMDTDLWMVNNLAGDPAYAEIKQRLKEEVARWRRITEDYNASPTELVRRTERFTPLAPAPGSGADDFNGKTGPLNADTNWTTRLFGNAGADFALGGNRLDAPPGPFALATFDPGQAPPDTDWTMQLRTGFFGAGVAAGAVFGYQDDSNFYRLQIQDLRGADTGAWYVRFTRRAGGSDTHLWQVSAPGNSDGDAVFADSTWYRLEVHYTASTDSYQLMVVDPASRATPLYATTVADSTFRGGGFGVFANSSGSSGYDDISVQVLSP